MRKLVVILNAMMRTKYPLVRPMKSLDIEHNSRRSIRSLFSLAGSFSLPFRVLHYAMFFPPRSLRLDHVLLVFPVVRERQIRDHKLGLQLFYEEQLYHIGCRPRGGQEGEAAEGRKRRFPKLTKADLLELQLRVKNML